jgi:ATP-dependent Lhr-like helicase
MRHDVVMEEMKSVYLKKDAPIYLDTVGRNLLSEGRHFFRSLQLDSKWLLPDGRDTLIFVWKGSLIMNTLAALLLSGGFNVSQYGVALRVSNAPAGDIRAFFELKVASEPPSPSDLAIHVANTLTEKHDRFLSKRLIEQEYGARNFNCEASYRVVQALLQQSN